MPIIAVNGTAATKNVVHIVQQARMKIPAFVVGVSDPNALAGRKP
jgi:hypothetical protein